MDPRPMKDLKVSNETHSQLFSLKNKLAASHNKKFIYDDVVKFLLSYYHPVGKALDKMYQLEEKE